MNFLIDIYPYNRLKWFRKKSEAMSITPIVAAEIGVIITQSQTSLWRSRLVTILSKPQVKKVLNILAILLLLGCIVTIIHTLQKPYSPPGQLGLDNHVEPPVDVPQGDITTLLSDEEREALVQKIENLEEPTPLGNYGNDCFINSCLQYIMHSSEFIDFLLNHNNLNLNESNSERFYRLFLRFCREYSQGVVSFPTKAFRKELGHREIESYDQDCASKVLNEVFALYRTDKISHENTSTRVAKKDGIEFYNNAKQKFVPMINLYFPEHEETSLPLEALWKHTFQDENMIDPDDSKTRFIDVSTDPFRKEYVEADSIMRLENIEPKNAIVHLCLNRSRDYATKIETKVDFNGKIFNNDNFYELITFTIHKYGGGSLQGGHYVTCFKQNDQWYYASDSSVYKIDEEQALEEAKSAYTLCFREIERPRSDTTLSDSLVGDVDSSDGRESLKSSDGEDSANSPLRISSDEDM